MKSRATPQFWNAYSNVPQDIRGFARKAYKLFAQNPSHPSLNLKRVHRGEPIYSVRVTLEYRAVGLLEDGEMIWFWIGNHTSYDRLLRNL